jgi:hypothetical protein
LWIDLIFLAVSILLLAGENHNFRNLQLFFFIKQKYIDLLRNILVNAKYQLTPFCRFSVNSGHCALKQKLFERQQLFNWDEIETIFFNFKPMRT